MRGLLQRRSIPSSPCFPFREDREDARLSPYPPQLPAPLMIPAFKASLACQNNFSVLSAVPGSTFLLLFSLIFLLLFFSLWRDNSACSGRGSVI